MLAKGAPGAGQARAPIAFKLQRRRRQRPAAHVGVDRDACAITGSLWSGDLAGLAEPSLAAAREFAALAGWLGPATTRMPRSPPSLQPPPANEVAFTWLWALVRESEQRWRRAMLPNRVAVPEHLQQQVTEFHSARPRRPSAATKHHAASHPGSAACRGKGRAGAGVAAERGAGDRDLGKWSIVDGHADGPNQGDNFGVAADRR